MPRHVLGFLFCFCFCDQPFQSIYDRNTGINRKSLKIHYSSASASSAAGCSDLVGISTASSIKRELSSSSLSSLWLVDMPAGKHQNPIPGFVTLISIIAPGSVRHYPWAGYLLLRHGNDFLSQQIRFTQLHVHRTKPSTRCAPNCAGSY